jgi:hypothetical protein
MQNVVADDVILGNIGGAGSIVDELTGTEVTAMLNVATTSLPGLGPARTGGASTDYLSADGTYTVPATGSVSLSKSITVEDPLGADDLSMFFTPVAITVTNFRHLIVGTTNVQWKVQHASTRDGTPLDVHTTLVTTSTSGTSTNPTGDTTIPANSYVWYKASAISDTPTQFHLTLTYTED